MDSEVLGEYLKMLTVPQGTLVTKGNLLEITWEPTAATPGLISVTRAGGKWRQEQAGAECA